MITLLAYYLFSFYLIRPLTNGLLVFFVESLLVATAPPFTFDDLDDMSKRLSVVELKKIETEHAKHESAG